MRKKLPLVLKALPAEGSSPWDIMVQFGSVQSLSRVWLFVTPMDYSTPGFPVLHYLLQFTQIHVHWMNRWRHPTVSSLIVPFSCPQSFPTSRSFQMSWLFALGRQSIGASASASVFPFQGWFPLGWTGRISSLSKGVSRVFFNTTVQQHQFFDAQPSLWSSFHISTWLLEKL